MEHPYADFIGSVEKPARYLGGEYQSIRKDWNSVELRLGEREFPAGALDPAVIAAVAEAGPGEAGARLFAAFVADERVRMAWNLAAALAPRRRIRLRIDDDAPELHTLPWEALRDVSPAASLLPKRSTSTTSPV